MGKKYISLIDGCVWDPITYPAGWQEVTETVEEVNAENGTDTE